MHCNSATRFVCFAIFCLAIVLPSRVQAEPPQAPKATEPSSNAPDGCPFPRSQRITKLIFTGRHKEYTAADTWYPSWASDDRMYSPFTDGTVNGVVSHSGYHQAETTTTGYAVIEGSDPLNLKIVRCGLIQHTPFPYGSQYPCGSLVHDGIWYYGSYNLDWKRGPWDTMGPFVGFNISTNFGNSWLPETRTALNPLFGESAKTGEPVQMFCAASRYRASPYYNKGTPGVRVKIGAPHFVDFGMNMEHSPDGKAYLVAHGAVRADSDNSWISGDQVYLLRVKPSVESINDPSQYEFFGGRDHAGAALWTKELSRCAPIAEWNDNAGCATMAWNNPLKTYFLCVTYGGKLGGGGRTPYDTYVLESKAITGPWSLVTYMKQFGPQGYFVNLPSKFISPDGKTMWLCYSANWAFGEARGAKGSPPGSDYKLCLQEIQINAE